MMDRFTRHKYPWYRVRSVTEAGFERAETRLKLWKFEASITERWARSRNMSFVPALAAAFNDDHFLGRKYYYDDATHANAAYGALVVEQLKMILWNNMKQAAHG